MENKPTEVQTVTYNLTDNREAHDRDVAKRLDDGWIVLTDGYVPKERYRNSNPLNVDFWHIITWFR
jgi:hypothetical protein